MDIGVIFNFYTHVDFDNTLNKTKNCYITMKAKYIENWLNIWIYGDLK